MLSVLLMIAVQSNNAVESAPVEPATTTREADPPAETRVVQKRPPRRLAGSAHVIGEEQLERFDADDIHRVLRHVPGVYIRDEDGFGLRPNIGFRGASSDRSAKVVLLEDGVLFGPAPYSAPAAYYFPLTTRMVGVEVSKGPAAIRQGPHTVGGALNLRTRSVPVTPMARLDSGFGFTGPHGDQLRLHGVAGVGDLQPFLWGVMVEGARVQSSGFKHMMGQANDTGFVRDDAMLKARIGTDPLGAVRHTVELKLGFQREDSRETYLGLSDGDFRRDALQRYAASADDHMLWTRTQGQLRYTLSSDDIELDVVAYRHDLERSWTKVNGLRDAPGLHPVLTFAEAGVFPVFVQRLRRGEPLGGDTDNSAILIGPNQRTFFSQGIATTLRGELVLGPVSQQLEAGVRLHQDGVRRRHSERGFRLIGASLVDLGEADAVTANNEASATAVAAHVADTITIGSIAFVPGVRVEFIQGRFVDNFESAVDAATIHSHQVAVMPGIGAAWQVLPGITVLGGVHRGFSPVAPGQTAAIEPETSINGEAGVRLELKKSLGLSGEAIGFYSHYLNILGDCTYSSGCVADVGAQNNGGAASIAGVELALNHELPLRHIDGHLKTSATYTFTRATFLTTFDSPNPLMSRVTAGDDMAYVPNHQASFMAAWVTKQLDVGMSLGMVSAMRDVPGQGAAAPNQRTDAQAIVDVAAGYQIIDGVRISLRIDNVFDQRAIVSRRPFGARPNKPLSGLVSVELDAP